MTTSSTIKALNVIIILRNETDKGIDTSRSMVITMRTLREKEVKKEKMCAYSKPSQSLSKLLSLV